MLSKPRPGSDQRTAADPDTPLEWFQNQVDDRIVMAQALVSHGNVSERFALVYQVYREDLLRKLETKSFKDIHLDPNAMIFRIARREDAPLEILEDIEATFALAPLMLDLSSNPRLPQAMLNRLVEGLLGRDFESSGKNREVADILLKLAANPRLEAQAFAVLSKRIMENIDTDTVDYDYRRSAEILAGNPAVPAALLDDWANWMLTRDEPEFVQLAAALLQHPAMPTDSLERLGTRMFTPTYKGFAWVFTSILENPNLTPGLLQQMVKLHGGDSGKSSRYALQAMMHPNYDQPALYQLLTASNHRLVKDLLQYRDYVQNPALPEKEIRYLASPEVIRHIFEMPGSDRFIGEVAANPNTPRDILYNLLRRKAPEIDRKLITNTAP